MAFDYKITKIDRARKIVTVECLPEEPHGKEVHKADEESRSAEEGAKEEGDDAQPDAGQVQEEVGRVRILNTRALFQVYQEAAARILGEPLSSKNGPHED